MIDLKDKRTEKKMSQEELANQCGVFRTHISNIEKGITKPSVNLAKKIGQILEFDWTEFYED